MKTEIGFQDDQRSKVPSSPVEETTDVEHNFFQNLVRHQLEPVLKISREPVDAILRKVGAKAISAADPYSPDQIHLPEMYVGATSPHASTEVPHWHQRQTEVYFLVHGRATMTAKRPWDDVWVSKTANPGTVLLVQPQVCHWFRWASKEGLAYVFKAPQIAGVGRPPAGKTTCEFCPHYKRGCKPPDGFTAHDEGELLVVSVPRTRS